MNKHFHDARYYLQRAGEHLALGVRETVAPVTERVQNSLGDDEEPEPTRWEALSAELREETAHVADEVSHTLEDAKATATEYRERRTAN